jgi:protein phosphatase
MVVCPHCRLENPDNNKFCQGCGTSLSHQDCPHCGASVEFGEEKCDRCGGDVGTVLWVTIAHKIKSEPDTAGAQVQLPIMGAKGISYSEFSLAIEDLNQQQENGEKLPRQVVNFPSVGEFLDTDQRYQLKLKKDEEVAKIFESQDSFCLVQGKVLDRQPLQQFHLKRIQQQRPELFKELYQSCSKTYLSFFQYWNLVGVPTFALPYLSLQQFTPQVPEIYDAWQTNDRGIVLLPDRSNWQTLTELWQTHDLSPLAISWLLSEMAKLWTPLCAIGCAESLLIPDNLRVDEDRCFALQKLYLDAPNREYTLKDLVQVWQALLTECRQASYESLDRLLNNVISGEIDMVKELRSQLENLSTEEQLEIERESPPNPIPTENLQAIPTNDLVESDSIETEQNLDREIEAEIEAEMNANNELDNWENIDFDSDRNFEALENPTEDPTVVLSLGLDDFADAGCSDIGSHRDHNEDCFGMETEIKKQQSDRGKSIKVKGLYVVCDGMGGHEAGEVASAMAVKTLQDYFHTYWQNTLPDEQTIREGVLLANQTLYKINLDNARSGHSRMGTTMVMVLLQDDKFAIAHVGDSRIYRITRSQGLEKLTTDHEVGQREILRGVEPQIAYARPDAYQLTQALGPRNDNFVKPEIQFFEVQEDSVILLCSDGLSDNDLIEKYWDTKLSPLIDTKVNLDEGLANVIDFANHYSGHDNITGVAVRVNLRPSTEK